MELKYGSFETEYGLCWMLFDECNLYALQFFGDDIEATNSFKSLFSGVNYVEDNVLAEKLGAELLRGEISLNLMPQGSPFQKLVWDALLQIPRGATVCYTDIATIIGKPKAVRAVANAIGANPIAILIPCHRIIRSDGQLGGYRWGLAMKKQLLIEEATKR